MKRRSDLVATVAALVVALTAFGSATFLIDPTPLLVEPSPDLDWPLGLLGFAAGFWSASHINELRYVQNRRFGRIALWIMLPLTLGFGLPAFGDRVHEALSFRRGASIEEATVLVNEKRRSTSRGGRVFYEVGLVSPVDGRVRTLRVEQATFERVEPQRECVTIAVERAPNGAARLLRPLRWQVRCPWTSG